MRLLWRFSPFNDLSGRRIDPVDILFIGDGIDYCDRIHFKKTGELLFHAIEIACLDLGDPFTVKYVCDKTPDLYFLLFFVGFNVLL